MNSPTDILVWALVVLGIVTGGITSVTFTFDDQTPSITTYLVFGGAVCVALAGLAFQARRDLYAVCAFNAVVGALLAMITGAVALFGFESHPIAGTVAVVCVVVVLASGTYLVWSQYGAERLPNLLAEHFDPSETYEVSGVQFAARISSTTIPAGETVEVEVMAQNTWDAERVFVFRIDPVPDKGAKLIFDRAPSITLGPGEVGTLHIPIVPSLTAKGRYELFLDPRVRGSGGARVRRRRSTTYERRTPGSLTAFAALGGVLVFGGGSKFELHVGDPTDGMDAPSSIPQPARTETVWSPPEP